MSPALKAKRKEVEQKYYEESMGLTPPEVEIKALNAVQQAIATRLDSSAVLQMMIDEARRLSPAESSGELLRNQQAAAVQPVDDFEEHKCRIGELHDALTQTLFSANLIADVLLRLWQINPQEGQARVEELRQLTRGALAEMRTLLIELHPSALTESTFDTLIAQLADCCAARACIPMNFHASPVCALADDVQIALYRITQEALYNICKEGGASQVSISLNCDGNAVALAISAAMTSQAALAAALNPFSTCGMQERARGICASVQVNSLQDCAVQIIISWPG